MVAVDQGQRSLDELFPGRYVISVPEAGKIFGLGRTASYEMAKKGLLPVIQTGTNRRVVSVAALEKMLSGDAQINLSSDTDRGY